MRTKLPIGLGNLLFALAGAHFGRVLAPPRSRSISRTAISPCTPRSTGPTAPDHFRRWWRCTIAAGSTSARTQAELYSEWAKQLVAETLWCCSRDSLGSRGIGSQCRERNRQVHASRQRVADANAARLWLLGKSYVRGDHISLLGWSNGGVAALWTCGRRRRRRDGSTDFRSAVAFYPNCRRLHETAWSARVPTLILIGSADDWTPASTCQQMVAGAHGRSARAEIVVYPGAHHDFDRAKRAAAAAHRSRQYRRPVRQRTWRHQPGRPRRRAQARAAMAGEIAVSENKSAAPRAIGAASD